MTGFKLHPRQRTALERLVAHSPQARLVIRAYALLWLDQGVTPQQIAARLGTSRQSIYNWAQRFTQGQGLALAQRLADAPRSGRPAVLKGRIEPLIASALEQDPRLLGYHATVWTAPLLVFHLRKVHELRVSVSSVRLALDRLGIRWKRPRHTLALRPKFWRQAKGGLKRGSSSTPAR